MKVRMTIYQFAVCFLITFYTITSPGAPLFKEKRYSIDIGRHIKIRYCVTSIQKYSKNGNGRAANLATAVQHN